MGRICFYADESYQDRETGKFHVIRIEEDQPGYWIETSTPSLDQAKSIAARENTELRLTDEDVLNIRISSMTASRRQEKQQ
jgi:hypothetical protein